MANDRIFFKCRHCGETKMLAKYYPTMGHGVWDQDVVADWVGKHMMCSPAFYQMNLQGDRCFDLFTESDNRFQELYQPAKDGAILPRANSRSSG
jgi:hypothetical protein